MEDVGCGLCRACLARLVRLVRSLGRWSVRVDQCLSLSQDTRHSLFLFRARMCIPSNSQRTGHARRGIDFFGLVCVESMRVCLALLMCWPLCWGASSLNIFPRARRAFDTFPRLFKIQKSWY